MGLFDNILRSDQTLVRNEEALGYEFLPKVLPFRKAEQEKIAAVIHPLFSQKNGRNAFIYGSPGIGKTAATKAVVNELDDHTDDIIPIYVNCWNKNTTYKILLEMCDYLDYKFTQNKRTEELFKIVKGLINRKSAVFVFDEIDKVEDFDFLYNILEEVYKKSIILVTNYKDWLTSLDERIRSRLLPEMIEFKEYTIAETRGILDERRKIAFYPNVWEQDAFDAIVNKTAQIKDIRTGIYLLKESAVIAESRSSKKILKLYADEAISKVSAFHIKEANELEDEEQRILELVKKNSGHKIGDLFRKYEEEGGSQTYKTFQRRIDKLEKGKYISVKKTEGGKDGNTTIVSFGQEKKLTEF